MKGKTTVKGTRKAPTTVLQGTGEDDPQKVSHTSAVPISVYRELAKELDRAKQQLSTVSSQNSMLQQQNQALRQEVIRVIQSAAALKDILQAPQRPSLSHPNPNGATVIPTPPPQSSPRSDNVADELIAELDRTLAADIRTSLKANSGQTISQNSTGNIVDGPFCEVTPPNISEDVSSGSPTPLFTEQPTVPPNAIALENEKAKPLGGIWLPLTLVFVIVTAFSAGFLVVLPFLERSGQES